MRLRHFNFALAIGVSLVVHALLWPASKHLLIPNGSGDEAGSPRPRMKSITLLLNPRKADAPLLAGKPIPPKALETDSPDQMGEATGKGTGAQAAKGAEKLAAPEGDQDQAFLSRDPVGHGKVGDPPVFDTGPRGQDGSGGQRGGPRIPTAASSPKPSEQPVAAPRPAPANNTAAVQTPSQAKPPRTSVVKTPEDVRLIPRPSEDIAPPPAQAAAIGAAKPDLNKRPGDEIKAMSPLASVSPIPEAPLHVAPVVGPVAAPSPASSTAPPMPSASWEKTAVAMAVQVPLPTAVVAAPPPPAVDIASELPATTDLTTPPKALLQTPTPAPPAPPRLATGDGRAPGRDQASADPAQESDSESDAFQKAPPITAVYHDGRLEVRGGRKVKTTRPHLLPGAMGALMAAADPTVVFRVSIDATGNVKHVEPVKTSGSIELDQPCERAIYEWWFEPTNDKHGRPVADVFFFTIGFR